MYGLVDNDPWGYYIYSVVKQGSINLAFESERMAIPKAKFIGLSSADPEVVSKDDVEMLQDLILAAVNDAHRKVDEALAGQMQGMMGGMRIPGLS